METLLSLAGLIALGAFTPGPNNVVVLDAGTRGGITAALPSIAGVVAGSLAMLALVAGGLSLAFAAPGVRTAIALAGAAYLAWLGVVLWRTSGTEAAARIMLPHGAAGLFAFQFANPKAWLLAATVAAAAPPGLAVFGLYAAIPAVSLLVWAGAGAALARWLESPAHRRRVDRASGVLLVAFAAWLMFETLAGSA